MKNTTFRKKALLSSVAMLLVALVALGSATFAWFTANPNVDAKGLKMTTTASAGLVGISDSEVILAGKSSPADVSADWWDHDVVLRAKYNGDEIVTNPEAQDLQPVSGIGTSKYTIAAANDDEYDADTTKPVTGSSAFYTEKIYFKSTDGSAVEQVYFKGIELTKVTTSPIANALRVEVIAGGNVLGTYGFDGVGNVYLTKEGTYAESVTMDNKETTDVNEEKKYVCELPAISFAEAIECGSIAKDGMLEVTVNVFLDGEHESCYSRNAINVGDIINFMNLHFSSKA